MCDGAAKNWADQDTFFPPFFHYQLAKTLISRSIEIILN